MNEASPAAGTQHGYALGTLAVLFGLLAASWHANEWMKISVVGDPPYTLESQPAPDCEEDELEEEGLSLAECNHMAVTVHSISLSAPHWFQGWHMGLSAIGTLLATVSVFVGVALVDYRRWATTAAVTVFAALLLVDTAAFIAVVNTGPLLRQAYLWTILVWFFVHLSFLVGALAGREDPLPARERP